MFITCPYCSSTVYLDKSSVVFHWVLAPTLDAHKARTALARWMAGNQTVKDLDKKASIEGHSFEYFPVWSFKRRHPDGEEDMLLEPAAATATSELKRINLPAGDLRDYAPELESQARPPTVPLDAALTWLAERQVQRGEIVESALVHVPLYTFKYAHGGKRYTAVVEGATGQVLANIYPAKAEEPYWLAGGLAAAVFLCLAALPIAGGLIADAEGAGWGALAAVGLGIPAALVLFGLASWVASRV
jgi:hypothetical protein